MKINKEKIIRREQKSDLILQMNNLTPEFSSLLGKYFLCEKLSKRLAPNKDSSDKTLKLQTLKASLKKNGLSFDDKKLDKIFLSSMDSKTSKSFRVIRDNVCHSCSVSYKDYALKFYKEFDNLFDEYLNVIFERLAI